MNGAIVSIGARRQSFRVLAMGERPSGANASPNAIFIDCLSGYPGGVPDVGERWEGGAPTMKKATTMKRKSAKTAKAAAASPSKLIDERVAALGDWRGETLARVRAIIKRADPQVIETWKWRGVPVWEHDGIICTGETYKNAVKLTFAKGAALDDAARLFNSSLEGNVRRAIDFHEGDKIDEKALAALIRAAVALNTSRPARQARKKSK
jgi:hypothetical protein